MLLKCELVVKIITNNLSVYLYLFVSLHNRFFPLNFNSYFQTKKIMKTKSK